MGLHILAADDNEFAGLQYKKVFEKHQHDITVAKDGEACVEAYKKRLEESHSDANPFHIVLLDFVMPRKTAYE